jgi:hypothetical protein
MDPSGIQTCLQNGMAQQNQSGNAGAKTCDTEKLEGAVPECGLQPSEEDFAKRDASFSKADRNRRGWRKIVRNFTPS